MIEYNEMGVAELTQRIVQDLKSDHTLSNVAIRGEISNFKYSGPHAYFSLKENDYLLNCVMFNAVYKLRNKKIEEGTLVKAYGAIRVYTKRGTYQLYTEAIEVGRDFGELYRRFEALKRKLMANGIFDKPKKSLPLFPRKIAVVASRTSAAFQDVLNTVNKRYPLAEILLFHTGVQGEAATSQIVNALEQADNSDADVVLLVRGGGSIEDLWNFNEERVVMKVYNMKKPVVTGVGHEVDTTLVDYVADMRAPTPTGAAERVTPDLKDIERRIEITFKNLSTFLLAKLSSHTSNINHMRQKLSARSPSRILEMKKQNVETFFERISRRVDGILKEKTKSILRDEEALKRSKSVREVEIFKERVENVFYNLKIVMRSKVEKNRYILDKLESELKAHDPRAPLKKGYSFVYKEGSLVTSANDLQNGDVLKVVLADGFALTNVKEVHQSERYS